MHLDEEKEIRILTLRGSTLTLLDVVFVDIDTLHYGQDSERATDDAELTILVLAGFEYGYVVSAPRLGELCSQELRLKLRYNSWQLPKTP
jgi:hypothetical protein